jgi:hypothetical protein
VVQQIIGELKKARLPEDRHMELIVGEQRVRLRLSNILEAGPVQECWLYLSRRVCPRGREQGPIRLDVVTSLGRRW